MIQDQLFDVAPSERLTQFSKSELIEFVKQQQDVIAAFQRKIDEIQKRYNFKEQEHLTINEQYIVLKNKLFGRSSEKLPSNNQTNSSDNTKKENKKRVLLPSQRYPETPILEQDIEFENLPKCPCCEDEMQDSGMTEDSEHLTVIPKKYLIIRQKRHKYRCCNCHGSIVTAPLPPRIKEGSSLSDEMMIDVAMTKYCDLIPVERYSAIAGRCGLNGLPPQSLIESTHYLAEFVKGVYDKLRTEITESQLLHADETPHRMLEGDKKHNWYLWGFSTKSTSFFECHNTRSGDVASELLSGSKCEYLVSDVYSGYSKAVDDSNEFRKKNNLPFIEHVYCNAHARRYFNQAIDFFPEAKFFVNEYRQIYELEALSKEKPPDEILNYRSQMAPHFDAMKKFIVEHIAGFPNKSTMAKAMRYFLKNYDGLTRFLNNALLPIDNNPQERLLRNPVIGRKTWYGTHSKLGAKTAAILFSLVESCKLNKINPREYIKILVQDLHKGLTPYTPLEFKLILSNVNVG